MEVDRIQPEGARSGPGDVDLVMYSLRRYLRLAAKGNPTVVSTTASLSSKTTNAFCGVVASSTPNGMMPSLM